MARPDEVAHGGRLERRSPRSDEMDWRPLDRIHNARGILTCFDLTATPFAPTGKKSGQETLFGWMISDFKPRMSPLP